MPSPRKRLTAVERRAQILDSASLLFAEKGVNGVTTREIAQAAGISEPVLYQHFKSKDEIYVAMESICHNQTAYFHQLLRSLEPGVETLIRQTYLLVAVISFRMEPGQPFGTRSRTVEILLRLMGFSFLEDGRFARVLVQDCIGSIFGYWEASLRQAHKDGDLEGDRVDVGALWQAYQQIIGVGLFALPRKPTIERDTSLAQSVKEATLFALRGIGVREKVLRAKLDWRKLQRDLEGSAATLEP